MKAEVEDIVESHVNGQGRQMVAQIEEYGSEFWSDLADYLESFCFDAECAFRSYTSITKLYHIIKAR